jgi:hypothetical protein
MMCTSSSHLVSGTVARSRCPLRSCLWLLHARSRHSPPKQVRLQLYIVARNSGMSAAGLVQTATHIVKAEGLSALWKGSSAALMRSMSYGGLRFGLYKPIKGFFAPDGKLSVSGKFLSALGSGAIASFITNPIELVKVRLQASDSANGLSVTKLLAKVYETRGLRGFWAGSFPSVARGSMLTASQCVTYEESKGFLAELVNKPTDSFTVHLLASLVSGVASTTMTNPFDVVKTYMFVNRGSRVSDCVRDIFVYEGPRAFFKGWLAGYMRLGPQTTLIFLFSEQIRRYFGVEAV